MPVKMANCLTIEGFYVKLTTCRDKSSQLTAWSSPSAFSLRMPWA